jgi:hypothetical protein
MRFSRSAGIAAIAAAISALSLTAEAQDRRVSIINDTSVDMVEFYGSNVNATTWEEDILGANTLPAGSSVTVNFDDGSGQCIFDFRAIFADGDELIREDINVCEIGEYRYHQ